MSRLAALWIASTALAGLGSWWLFDAAPGVNWGLWALGTAAGLGLCARAGGRATPSLLFVLALTGALATASPFTADPEFHLCIAAGTLGLLAVAQRLAEEPGPGRVDAGFLAGAPWIAAGRLILEAARRVGETIDAISTDRGRPVARGTALALLIGGGFWLLLAGTDPLMDALREQLFAVLAALDFLPRLLFFIVLLVAALGCYGIALRDRTAPARARGPRDPLLRIGDTERLIVSATVTGLFGLFLLLQVSYLFGNAPAVAGSGVTFAEYARRGFGELTVAATLSTLLVLALRPAAGTPLGSGVRAVELVLMAQCECLLASAWNRVDLYEAAYGFTTARLYAQAYMAVLALVLLLLAREIWGGVEPARLLRRAAALGALAVIVLAWWNHEAWIARRNLDRYVRTGRLDAHYLVWGLSKNAVPAVVDALDRLPAAGADELKRLLRERYGGRARLDPCRWFEWNLREREAARALLGAGLGPDGPQVPTRGCVRIARGSAWGR
ncbi:MAG TPA: DUF4173 domain-containing protein [Methylomirabilota bacterium]|nr:DUF4173 domain-containing protein [Methylomirabilota bacterium]